MAKETEAQEELRAAATALLRHGAWDEVFAAQEQLEPIPMPQNYDRVIRLLKTGMSEMLAKHRMHVLDKTRALHWCVDCGRPADPGYMLRDEVWYKAMPEYQQLKAAIKAKYTSEHQDITTLEMHVYLCLPCVAHRLGRQVKLEDFAPVRINSRFFLGALLALENLPTTPQVEEQKTSIRGLIERCV